MIAHNRPVIVLALAAVLVAGSSAWLIAASDSTSTDPQDSTADAGGVIISVDGDDFDGTIMSEDIAREVHRALAEAMAGLDEAMTHVRGLSVKVEPLDHDRGRMHIRVDHDGDVNEAVIDPVEIQERVAAALEQVDFDRLGVDLERSMEQLGAEMGRMGEELGRSFEDAHVEHEHDPQVSAGPGRAQDDLDREVYHLQREIEVLQRQIARLQARAHRGDARHYD